MEAKKKEAIPEKKSKPRLSLEIDPELVREMKHIAVEEGCSLTQLTQRLFREHIAHKKNERKAGKKK